MRRIISFMTFTICCLLIFVAAASPLNVLAKEKVVGTKCYKVLPIEGVMVVPIKKGRK